MTVLELAKRWAEPPRILVVERSTETAKILTAMLAHYECVADTAHDLPTTLAALRQKRYSMALVDVELPGGVDIVRAIKEEAPFTPVLVSTDGTERWLEEIFESQQTPLLRPPLLQQTLRNTFTALRHATTIA